jgi:diguanylate cyclase (GGDEF)-like protein
MLVLGVILFLFCAVLVLIIFKSLLKERRLTLVSENAKIREALSLLESQKRNVEAELSHANFNLTKTVKIYEAARDICASLEEGDLFERFKEDLKKMMDYENCRLLPREVFDATFVQGSAVFPLVVQDVCLGYLVINGVSLDEQPFLGILAAQFALGLKRARLYKMIQELAITDSVTGLYTRRYAMDRLSEEFLRSQEHHLSLSILMIDADNFKECNDKFGHLVGDMVLNEIGRRIKENVREVDMVSRFGGEEFLVFAPNTSKESATLFAERIRRSIEGSFIRAYDEKVHLTVSVGVASYPEDTAHCQDLIGKSDQALYQAKKSGKNKVCVF